MTRRTILLLATFVLAGLHTAQINAQAADQSSPTAEARAEDLDGWIKQLDADRFGDRQAASDKLAEAGARAIPALSQAAESGSAETATRAVSILSQHLAKGNADSKAAAKTALEKLAASENPVAARRAKAALEESQAPPEPNRNARAIPLRIFGNGGIQIQGGQIQIQFQNNGQPARRVMVTTTNGVKQIEADEGPRKIKIKDDPNNGIEVEITETKDGKPATQQFRAKNAAELKKNHPEAHKVYEQYANPGQAPAPEFTVRRAMEMRLDMVQRQLDSMEQSADQLEATLGKDGVKALKQRFENAKKELDQVRKKMAEEAAKPDAEKPAPETKEQPAPQAAPPQNDQPAPAAPAADEKKPGE